MAQDIDKQQQPTSPDRATPSANGLVKVSASPPSSSSPRGHGGPADRGGPPSLAAPTGQLKFSIDRILSPEFGPRTNGRHSGRARKEAAAARRQDPTPVSESSGDESRLQGVASPEHPPTKGGKSGQQGLLWPAWVYCTRYSDRPSSGTGFPTIILRDWRRRCVGDSAVIKLYADYKLLLNNHADTLEDGGILVTSQSVMTELSIRPHIPEPYSNV